MKTHTHIVSLFSLTFSCLLFSTHLMALDFTPSEIQWLAEGKLIRKPLKNSCQNGFYGGAGFSVIDAPVDEVWKALEKVDDYPKIFPKTVAAKTVSRKDNLTLVKLLLGYKILSINYHITLKRDWESKTISFDLAKSMPHDIDAARGYWKLIPQNNDRTLVAYAVSIRIPAGIVAFLGESTEKSLERNLIGLPQYLKKYIESSCQSQ